MNNYIDKFKLAFSWNVFVFHRDPTNKVHYFVSKQFFCHHFFVKYIFSFGFNVFFLSFLRYAITLSNRWPFITTERKFLLLGKKLIGTSCFSNISLYHYNSSIYTSVSVVIFTKCEKIFFFSFSLANSGYFCTTTSVIIFVQIASHPIIQYSC